MKYIEGAAAIEIVAEEVTKRFKKNFSCDFLIKDLQYSHSKRLLWLYSMRVMSQSKYI